MSGAGSLLGFNAVSGHEPVRRFHFLLAMNKAPIECES